MRVSVIIPVYNEEQYIRECLESLRSQTSPADEIIIVDNNCKDGTMEIIKDFDVKTITEKEQGMIPARNAGFEAALYEILARCDADTILPDNWIATIKEDFKNKEIVGWSSRWIMYDLRLPTYGSQFWRFIAFTIPAKVFGQTLLFGSNMAITKEFWNKIKKDVCKHDSDCHEDHDISIHGKRFGKYFINTSLIAKVSSRRMKKPISLIIYPYKFLKMMYTHRDLIRENKKFKVN